MAASPAPKESPNETSARGRDAVRQRLLAAAADLLASAPPTEVTGREIAELAGVNHGQIHHYFGSKDGLVAATVEDSTARYHQDRLQGGLVFPLPIETSRRSPAWRTLAYLAMTGEWRRPPFEPSPVVASLAHRRGEDLGRKPSSPDVMAEVAATMALQRGWWIFQDIIEAGFAGYRPKLARSVPKLRDARCGSSTIRFLLPRCRTRRRPGSFSTLFRLTRPRRVDARRYASGSCWLHGTFLKMRHPPRSRPRR